MAKLGSQSSPEGKDDHKEGEKKLGGRWKSTRWP